jgi:hypothetical protein
LINGDSANEAAKQWGKFCVMLMISSSNSINSKEGGEAICLILRIGGIAFGGQRAPLNGTLAKMPNILPAAGERDMHYPLCKQ